MNSFLPCKGATNTVVFLVKYKLVTFKPMFSDTKNMNIIVF